jgi:quercetin dioxygenase-like cupin family protein
MSTAEVLLPCTDLDATIDFFTGHLGFRLDTISPADDPRTAVVEGYGLRLRFERGATGDPGVVVLHPDGPSALAVSSGDLMAPNGTRVLVRPQHTSVTLPPLEPRLVVSRRTGDDAWLVGRAGMRYRDLLPGRLGGRVIASHIHIPVGGPVPDYVHYHRIHFQLICCRRGWVRVVYEDQGPPFVLQAGDCVLQPPGIRHRVLESSDDLEVIEVGCPAEHDTLADHDLALPTGALRPEREFGGQRFVHHVAADATWAPWRHAGFAFRDTGIGEASRGAGSVVVIRPEHPGAAATYDHDGEVRVLVVLEGALDALLVTGTERLSAGDALTVPAGTPCTLTSCTADLELLEVAIPAA